MRVHLYSAGGVSTRMFNKWLHKNAISTNAQPDVHHGWSDKCDKIIYLTGSPVDAVISFYRKNRERPNWFIENHAKNLKINHETVPKSIEEYDKDYFKLNLHNTWYTSKILNSCTPGMIINCDYLWKEEDCILDFLKISSKLPERRERSNRDWIPPGCMDKLNIVYKQLEKGLEKIKIVKNNEYK
jgi:hypothetical protein